MTLNNLKFSWRNIRRHQVFSVINITGLVMGITVCLLMLNFVVFEKSYDKFFERHEDIVRVGYTRLIDNQPQFSKAQVFPAVGEVLQESVPAVEQYARLFPMATHIDAVLHINDNNKSFHETSLFAVDSTFLKIFSIELLQGDKNRALSGENKVMLSESIAIKYFGHTDVLNKVITWNGMGDYMVTGVFKNLPENSHLKFDLLFSWMNVYEERSKWNWDGFYTYLLLKPNSNLATLEPLMQRVLNKKSQAPKDDRVSAQYFLQPLTSIHLTSNLTGEINANGNKKVVESFLLIAFAILLLAVFNYINLTIARSVKRAKEVGVRKIIGSTRSQLMNLFFTESFLLSLTAFIISIGLIFLLLPFLGSLAGKPIVILLWKDGVEFIGLSLLAIVIFSVLAGYYPSRVLTSFNPVVVLKGATVNGRKRNGLRRSLLLIQFVITIILVTASLLIQKQVTFMQDQDLGFALKQNIVINSFVTPGNDSTFLRKVESFKDHLKQLTAVKGVTITSNIPGRENEWIGRLRRSENDTELISASRTRVDKDFIQTYGLTLTAGKNFDSEDPNQVILNQSTVRMLGYKNDEEAIGNLLLGDSRIVGVVKDFHERSLHEPILPYFYTPGQGYMKFITVNIVSQDVRETLASIESQWKEIFPETPFEYFFLDEFFNRQYGKEKQLGNIFMSFSIIGVTIACLGLFGFMYFIAHQRSKEIGIRKTLGASFLHLIKLLSIEYASILMLAGVVAGPIGFYFLNNWLTKYPVNVGLQISDFILPVFGVGLLALLSIAAILIRAVKINPTEVLKNE